MDASGNCRLEQPRTYLREDEEEMIFDLLVAGAFALATLRRFGGTDSYSLLHPGEAGGELGLGSVRATYFCRVQPYGALHHRTLVTALRHYVDERGDESAAAAT